MFWDDPDDSRAIERLKNATILNIPLTNKERAEAMPATLVGTAVLIVLIFIILVVVAIVSP